MISLTGVAPDIAVADSDAREGHDANAVWIMSRTFQLSLHPLVLQRPPWPSHMLQQNTSYLIEFVKAVRESLAPSEDDTDSALRRALQTSEEALLQAIQGLIVLQSRDSVAAAQECYWQWAEHARRTPGGRRMISSDAIPVELGWRHVSMTRWRRIFATHEDTARTIQS